jgi:hypothetical protein
LRVIENGQPVRRVVDVVASNRVNAAIAKGLAAGEDVVIDIANVRAPQGSAPRPPRL